MLSRRIKLFTVLFSTLTFAALTIANLRAPYAAPAAADPAVMVRPVKNSSFAKNPMYILKIFDGMLAVFVPGESFPEYLTDIDARTLLESDRQILYSGIAVYSDEELSSLLEDFGS